MKQTIFLFIIITFLYSNQEGVFNVLDKDINKVTISFENEEIRTEKLDNYNQFIGYKTLTIDNGLPELPKYTLNYGLDPSKNYEISYNIINSHTINDVNIFPHQSVKKSNSEEVLGIYVVVMERHQNLFPKSLSIQIILESMEVFLYLPKMDKYLGKRVCLDREESGLHFQ